MAVINTKSIEVKLKVHRSPGTVRIADAGLFFSLSAAEMISMEKGDKVEFQRLSGGTWMMSLSDGADGFNVVDGKHGLIVLSRPLVRLIGEDCPYRLPETFRVRPCAPGTEYKGYPLFRIMFDEPYKYRKDGSKKR